MSTRELKALLSASSGEKTSGTRSGRRKNMSEDNGAPAELEKELADVKALLVEKEAELQYSRAELREKEAELRSVMKDVDAAYAEVDKVRMHLELDNLRAKEHLREQHEAALNRERELADADRKRTEEWLKKAEDTWRKEKQSLESRLALLESASRCPTVEVSPSGDATPARGDADSDILHTAGDPTPVSGDGVAVGAGALAVTATDGGAVGVATGGSSGVTEVLTGVTVGGALSGGDVAVRDSDATTGGDTEAGADGGDSESIADPVLRTVTLMLKAQTEAMAAQTKAVAVQHLPPLPTYTGEGREISDDGFDRWVEKLRERSRICEWTPEHRLYQMKLHLDQTAAEVYRMLPEEDRSDFEKAIKALGTRFRPVDIAELRGLEFHHKTQGKESVEQLGISLQQLGRKAFPSLAGKKEFDILLKGRFFQALHVKWQRKLGTPKTDESFYTLYDRARALEAREKQYSAGYDGTRNEVDHDIEQPRSSWGGARSWQRYPQGEPTLPPRAPSQSPVSTGGPPNRPSYRCYRCQGVGHMVRDCPQPRAEAPGRQQKTGSGTVGSIHPVVLDEVTDEQLEDALSQRRLQREQLKLGETSSTGLVQCLSQGAGAVGPTLLVDITIGGVAVRAMVDTGAQSTIISRSVLQEVGRQQVREGQPLPTLQKPTVHLYGKDGVQGGQRLPITAQLDVTLVLDGMSVCVPVFVQPDSSQPCLLGMNAIPGLGIQVTRANGAALCCVPQSMCVGGETSGGETSSEPLTVGSVCDAASEVPVSEDREPVTARVSLLTAVAIPSNTGYCLKAKVANTGRKNSDVLFEPRQEVFAPLGISVQESLLRIQDDGTVVIPAANFRGIPAKLESGVDIGMARVLEVDSVSECGGLCAVGKDAKESASCGVVEANSERFEVKSGKVEAIWCDLDLNSGQLSEEEIGKVKSLVCNFEDVFALNDGELGCTGLIQHHINTGDHAPVKQLPYRTPMSRRSTIAEMVGNMQEQGVVQPSMSPWSSPVVLVPKKDGTLRFCVDYRRLNSVTRKDVYPLPRIDDILDNLGGAEYFTSLDLASGYWQVSLDTNTSHKTAFSTHQGLFEFVRMPFGLCNAPATFQRLMQNVLAGLDWCFVYLDDILIVSCTLEEHLERLRVVLGRLRQAGLRLKPKKCHLFRREVHFLGHTISKNGVCPDPAKTEKVREYPTPTDVTSLRQFLGLASYYRRFVCNFAKIAAPLHTLTRKNVVFEWSDACEVAFCKLKDLLVTAPVLAYPRFGCDTGFILETDASYVGLGAILSQQQGDGEVHPIAYASRSLDTHERNYGISELETLGLVWAVRYFRPYLLGHPCLVYTDHSACLSILNSPRPSGKLARWALTIQEMDLTIKHKAGKNNSNADALSRNPVPEGVVGAIEAVSVDGESEGVFLDMVELREKQEADGELVPMLRYLRHGELSGDAALARRIVMESAKFELIDDVLHCEVPAFPGRYCVVVPESLRRSILEEAHSSCFGGHFAERKVHDRLRRFVWWKGMRGDVKRFCRGCLTCSTRKGRQQTFRPRLQPIPVGGPFHRVAVDILQLPLTVNGNKYVIVFMDYLTKWVEAFAIPDQKTETIARLFVDNVICRHGIPEELLSDRGTNFLSELLLSICEVLGVKKINTSGYHPQTDGLVEKFNSTLINLIAKCCVSRCHDWDEHLQTLLFAYRSSIQDSTRESPFFLLYGRDPRIPTSTVLAQSRSAYNVDPEDYRSELVVQLAEAWKLARENIGKAQDVQKRKYDAKRPEVNLEVGERVMVYMPSETTGKDRKLARPFHGPYRVVTVTPTNAEVRLVDQPKTDSIFVSLNRVRRCYPELGNSTWVGPRKKRKKSKKSRKPHADQAGTVAAPRRGPTTRSMTAAGAMDTPG